MHTSSHSAASAAFHKSGNFVRQHNFQIKNVNFQSYLSLQQTVYNSAYLLSTVIYCLSRNIYLEYTQCCLKHTAAILLLKPYHHPDVTWADTGFTDGNAEHFISYKPIDGKYPEISPPAYKPHILALQHRMSPLSI